MSHKLSSPLSEESITEFNLLRIKQRHRGQIITRSFTPHQEAISGGDWEWWLTGNSGLWIGFRIQAKIIDSSGHNYPHLHYKSPGSGHYQSDTLVSDSRCHGAIPLYCLYSYWATRPQRLTWRCGSFHYLASSYGCTLIQASVVLRLRAMGFRDTSADVGEFMYPWHCLFCCDAFSPHGDLPRRAWGYWQNNLANSNREFEANVDGYYGDVQLRQEPPRYVQLLAARDLVEAPDPRVRRITIIRENTNQT